MTLTEQWKKGELEQGWYYIECIDLPKRWIDIDYYRNDCYEDEGFCKGFFDHNDWRGIDKVLAPVPSYEEYDVMKYRSSRFSVRHFEAENQRLKELFKEVRSLWKGTICMPDSQEQVRDILAKIDNAIGEK